MGLVLHDFPLSGHSYRVRLLLSLLDLPHTIKTVDLASGAHKQPEFLKLNSFGQVPVLEDDDLALADSNAILVYLAEKYAPGQWYPQSAAGKAAVQRWLSVAAGPLAYSVSAARAVNLFRRPANPELIELSHALLAVIEANLNEHEFLTGAQMTIADISLYSYIVLAPEGGVSLNAYPNIRAWLARIEALPRFVPMVRTNIGLNAV